jgi:hypothetical protein
VASAAIRPLMIFYDNFFLSLLTLVTPPTARINSPIPTAVDVSAVTKKSLQLRAV